ncbi:MAG: RNA polymerase sigma factor [Muribaculaceae bacterium]|nr:RNA polymerase sigma factor [Muribaculaceae bacterium]MDE6552571.1 RNA polymerase sigma factor [Muribaculaceae bacterium]
MVSTALTYPPATLPLKLRMRFLWNRMLRFAALSKDEEATSSYALEHEFKELIDIENATISRICFSYSNTVDEFEDLRQDAIINIWRGMSGFRGESSSKTWIYRVTVNSCLSTIRKQSRHKHESLDGLYELIDSDDSDKEAIEELHRVINTLDPEEKAIIMMWLDELSYDEIGTAMGLNRNTIATRIRRIKEKITKAYKKEEII